MLGWIQTHARKAPLLQGELHEKINLQTRSAHGTRPTFFFPGTDAVAMKDVTTRQLKVGGFETNGTRSVYFFEVIVHIYFIVNVRRVSGVDFVLKNVREDVPIKSPYVLEYDSFRHVLRNPK